MSAPFRPTPSMASRADAALEYIKVRWALRGRGPSVREVAAALGTNRDRAGAILQQLEAAGSIVWRRGGPGVRGEVLLPDAHEQISVGTALQALRRARGAVGHDALRELLGDLMEPLTQTPLPLEVALDHLRDIEPVPLGPDRGGDGVEQQRDGAEPH